MVEINHAFPTDFYVDGDLQVGNTLPIDVTGTTSGNEQGTVRWSRAKRSMGLPLYLDGGQTALEPRWDRWLQQVRDDGTRFVWRDVTSRTRHNILCGIGDGSRTVFPVPFYGASGVTMFVAGAPQTITTDYYEIGSGNQLSEDEATFDGGVGSVTEVGTCVLSQSSVLARAGYYSCLVTPTGSQANVGIRTAGGFAAAEGQNFTALACVRGTGTFYTKINYIDSGGSVIGSGTTGSSAAGSAGAWTWYTVNGTAPATTAAIKQLVVRSTNSALKFWVDCCGVFRGDEPVWHRPSCAPLLIVFNSAPAAGAEITCNATGYELVQLELRSSGVDHIYTTEGHLQIPTFDAIERWLS